MDDVLSKEWKDDVIHMKNTQIERMHHVFFMTRFTFFVDQLFSGICLFVTLGLEGYMKQHLAAMILRFAGHSKRS